MQRVRDERLDQWLVASGNAAALMLTQLVGQAPDRLTTKMDRGELADVASYLAWRLTAVTIAIHGDQAAAHISATLAQIVADLRDLRSPPPDRLPDDW